MKKKDISNMEEIGLMIGQFIKEGEGRARPAIMIGMKDLVNHADGFSGELMVICSGGLDPLALVDLLEEALRLAKGEADVFPDPERSADVN